MPTNPAFQPVLCANCDSPAVTLKTPLFCSEWCRQVAEFVRYARSCHRDGRDHQPDVKETIKMRAATVLGGGGYPERQPASRRKCGGSFRAGPG